ncbi:hypothetical protein RND81_09G214800 [Saponaria officinalis]|uniref:Uncharacterized protein n=1 Tax=Saponaria officinalis TaxID=3572 RepID=A0AAW1IQU2_SAPOF
MFSISISSPLLPPKHHSTITITASSGNSPPPPQIKLIIPKSYNSPSPQNLYQPYRPPQSPLPAKYHSLDTAAIIDILSNRLGLWHDYAPLITSLFRDGFNPPSIEELTGISGVEQNCLVVAAQVRLSIVESGTLDFDLDGDVLGYFDSGGSELLYELRLLNTSQRAEAAKYIVRRKLFDGEKAKELARSIKDYPMRQGEKGLEWFDYNRPGDCLAFTYLRLSREFMENSDKRAAALATALEVAESDKAVEYIREEIEGRKEVVDEREKEVAVKVPVVRLKMGEVAEATTVVVLPVAEAKEGGAGVERVPRQCKTVGEFGFVVAEKGWDKWLVLPRWGPVAGIGSGGVAVAFPNAKALPWRVNRTYLEEAIVVVVDRARREVEMDDGFYLAAVGGGDGGLKVEKGLALKEMGMRSSLGLVVIVVRPPKDEDDLQLNEDDWD